METIKDYTVVNGQGIDRLTSAVQEHLKEGWQPIGGVAIATFATERSEVTVTAIEFAQAMVRYATE